MKLVILSVGAERFALESDLVDSIEGLIGHTPVPNSRPYIIGLINLRGKIIPLINMSQLLKMEDKNQQQNTIILRLNEELIGFRVDNVVEIIDIEEDEIEIINDTKVIKHNNDTVTLLLGKNLELYLM